MGVMLAKRQYYNNYGYYGGTWNNWVRWLVLGLIILAAVIIFCLLSCVTARRRRRRGFAPYRGTAWTLPRAQQGAPEPAPAYGAKDTQPYYPTTQPPAYEMNQQSANKDYGNNGVAENYAPPAGPPPAHTRPAA